jgi:hypothetical protein
MLVIESVQDPARLERAGLGEHQVERFLRGELCPAQRRRLVRHLIAGCPVCQATARSLWALGDRPLISAPRPRPRGAH